MATASVPILEITGLKMNYAGVITALDGIDLRLAEGEILALLGPNGAGKTSTLRAVSGTLGLHRGAIKSGQISFRGKPLPSSASACVKAGVAQVIEGRRIFASLTIEENLQAGGATVGRAELNRNIESTYTLFPLLKDRRREMAGVLSGGQQQMLAIGRALMSSPKLLLMDEPSLGLAPKVIRQIADVIVQLNQEGLSVLLVEQNANVALEVAHEAIILESGRVALSGRAKDLREDPNVQAVYLGVAREAVE